MNKYLYQNPTDFTYYGKSIDLFNNTIGIIIWVKHLKNEYYLASINIQNTEDYTIGIIKIINNKIYYLMNALINFFDFMN